MPEQFDLDNGNLPADQRGPWTADRIRQEREAREREATVEAMRTEAALGYISMMNADTEYNPAGQEK